MRLASSPTNFKNKLLSRVRTLAATISGIYDLVGLSYLIQLRVDLSNLNLLKFQRNFDREILAKVAELLPPFLNFTNLFKRDMLPSAKSYATICY